MYVIKLDLLCHQIHFNFNFMKYLLRLNIGGQTLYYISFFCFDKIGDVPKNICDTATKQLPIVKLSMQVPETCGATQVWLFAQYALNEMTLNLGINLFGNTCYSCSYMTIDYSYTFFFFISFCALQILQKFRTSVSQSEAVQTLMSFDFFLSLKFQGQFYLQVTSNLFN